MSSTAFRNLRKTVAVLLVLCLVISLLPINSVVNSASTGTVTVYHEDFQNGQGVATQSGSANLSVVDKEYPEKVDSKSLFVGNRTNNWDAADFKFSDLNLENEKTYKVTIKGYIDIDATTEAGGQIVVQALNPSPEAYDSYMGTAQITTGAAFTITANYTPDTSRFDRIRIQSNSEGAKTNFYIDDILITTEQVVSQTEVYHEDFVNGQGVATQSGGANLSVVDKEYPGKVDAKSLFIGNRTNNWDAADFNFSDLHLENGKTYKVTIKGYIDTDAVVESGGQIVVQALNPSTQDYDSYLGTAQITAGTAFTITGDYTPDTSRFDRIRIQSNNEGAKTNFYIDDILITTNSTNGGQVPQDPPRDPALPFNTITFEDQTTDGFAGRNGTEILTVTDEENHTEGGSYALKVENRQEAWHAPALHVEKYVDKGSEYKITAWVKLISPASSQIQLSTQIGSSSPNYVTLDGKTISTNDGWVKLEGIYRYNTVPDEFLTIYVESASNKTASYYIDDISFESTGSGTVDFQRDLTPIKDAYKNHFLIGTAISSEDLSGVRYEFVKMHHNAVTAGNAMKPANLQPTKGNFTFRPADILVEKALDEGFPMHGHVLVWHQQSPDWMYTKIEDGNKVILERDEALDNLRTHIKTVMEHFGDKVSSWDVVNEAMSDNPPNPADWQGSLRTSEWYQAIGPDYVEQAFLAAREVLDAHPEWDITLYYNDYNEDNQNKAQAIYNMVKEINDRYAATHPGKLLIDGIGMQAHYNIATNPENVKLSLEKFISLGVEISITELDITAGTDSKLTENQTKAQAYLYAQLFKIFKEHSDKIDRVTIWGTDDGTSWRSTQSPLLFDKNLQAKPAYYAAIDPDKYMAENPTTIPEGAKEAKAAYGTPVIDGTVDAIWNSAQVMPVDFNQAAWQGATGIAKALWDNANLYVLVQVSDSQLDKVNENAWEQDSVEIFIDENNQKTTFYQEDDGQYRVNFDNGVTINPTSAVAGFESKTKISGTNYTIEMKIPFKKITPAANKKIGFDAQINDAKDGARQGSTTWNDKTGTAYQDTSVFGVLTLAGTGGSQPGGGSGSGGGSSSSGSSSSSSSSDTSSSNNTIKTDKSEITVTLPATVKADGTAAGSVTTTLVDDIIRNIGNVKGSDEKPAITLSLNLKADTKAAEVKLPDGTLNKILTADKDTSIKIDAGFCAVVFDSKTIETISKAGTGEIEIKASKVVASEIEKLPAAEVAKIGDRPVYDFSVSVGGKTVSDFGNGTATVSIPYTPGKDEDPNAILVYYIDSNKNLIPVRGTYANGSVTFKTSHFSKFAISYNKVSFKDVKETDEFYSAVTYLGARDIVTGVNFEPTKKLTRGEAIVMLMKAYNIQPLENPQNNFSDAQGEFADYYAKAKEIGLTSGVGNNKLGVNSAITREALYTMMYNLKNYLGELPDKKVKEYRGFGDSDKISFWSLETITKLVESGLMKDGSYRQIKPKSACSRADFADMLYTLLSKNSIN